MGGWEPHIAAAPFNLKTRFRVLLNQVRVIVGTSFLFVGLEWLLFFPTIPLF